MDDDAPSNPALNIYPMAFGTFDTVAQQPPRFIAPTQSPPPAFRAGLSQPCAVEEQRARLIVKSMACTLSGTRAPLDNGVNIAGRFTPAARSPVHPL